MKKIVIMPGGFHPFHAGHYALYQSILQKFPDADVYVAATNDTNTRPFPFELKQKLAQLAGIDPNKFIQVRSPFRPHEIMSKYNPEQDALIFVRSEKDRNEAPIPGLTNKDGSPRYFQVYDEDNLMPFSKYAYIDYLPTVEFGPGIKSATEIRKAWPHLTDKRKLAMVMSLYPKTKTNSRLAQLAVKMLDAGILHNELTEQEEKQKEQDLDRNFIGARPDEQELLAFIRRHYPEAPTTQAAFIKYVLHSLRHSEEDSQQQEQEIETIKRVLKKIEQEIKNLKTPNDQLNESNIVKEIGYASYLDISKLSVDRLFKIGKKVGSINDKEVWKAKSGADAVYFIVTDNTVHALLGFHDGYLSNVLNITKKSMSVRELLGYIVHIEKQKVVISSTENLTEDGLKWIIYLVKRPSGLVITDQLGNPINPESLYKEWEQSRKTAIAGPTRITISENKEFGNRILENERRRQSNSLLLPFVLYDNDDYLPEK